MKAYSRDEYENDCACLIQVSDDLIKKIKEYSELISKFKEDNIYCIELFNYMAHFFDPDDDDINKELKDLIKEAIKDSGKEADLTDDQVSCLENTDNVGDDTITMKIHTDGSAVWDNGRYSSEEIKP